MKIGVPQLEQKCEDRAAFTKCFHGDLIYSMDGAIGFMVDACDVPFEHAAMWVCRVLVRIVRSGLYEAPREAPDWALGDVGPHGLFSDPESWTLENARGST